jgi:hypothetical protein
MRPSEESKAKTTGYRWACFCIIGSAAVAGSIINYRYCQRKVLSYARIERHLELFLRQNNSEELYDFYADQVEYYQRMECKYRYASWQPWLTLVPDPPEPKHRSRQVAEQGHGT